MRQKKEEENKKMKSVILTAIECDGGEALATGIVLQTRDDNLDFTEAVKAAVKEYCGTPAGAKEYQFNGKSFNWADFISSVPNDICMSHGFLKLDDNQETLVVDTNEQLFTEEDAEEVRENNRQWFLTWRAELQTAIDDRICNLEAIELNSRELDDDESEELEALRELDTAKDIQASFNSLAPRIWRVRHSETYGKYLSEELIETEAYTGAPVGVREEAESDEG
jgi:hypothetical protein